MIRYFLLISSFLFIVTLKAQPTVEVYLNNQTYINKNTSVESIEEKHELLIKELPSQPLRIVQHFNRSGYITNEKKFGKMNGLLSETSWEFDQNEKLVKKTHKYFVNMLGWRLEETLVTYNDSGFVSNIQFFKDGIVLTSSKVKCDSIGRPVYLRVYDGKGAHLTDEKLKYIPTANIIKVMIYKYTNQFVGSFVYPIDNLIPFQSNSIKKQYYPNGNIMLETLENSKNSDQGYYYEYKYDSHGNWLEKTTYQVTIGKNNKIKDKKAEHRIQRIIKYY